MYRNCRAVWSQALRRNRGFHFQDMARRYLTKPARRISNRITFSHSIVVSSAK